MQIILGILYNKTYLYTFKQAKVSVATYENMSTSLKSVQDNNINFAFIWRIRNSHKIIENGYKLSCTSNFFFKKLFHETFDFFLLPGKGYIEKITLS